MKRIKKVEHTTAYQVRMPEQVHYLVSTIANMNGHSLNDQINIILSDYCNGLLTGAGILDFYKSQFPKINRYEAKEWDDDLVYDIESKAEEPIPEEESELVSKIEEL